MQKSLSGSRLILASLTLAGAASLLAGCGAATGNTLARYDNGTMPPPPTQAPSDGMYGLYGTYDYNARVKYTLAQGDKLGFEMRDGKAMAVAGSNEVELQTAWGTKFYWKKEKMKS